MVVPPPDTRTQSKRLLASQALEFLQDLAPEIECDWFSIDSDYSFFLLHNVLWNRLLIPLGGGGRGPLLTALLRCYFEDERRQEGVRLFLPQAPALAGEVIANFCERYYTAKSFRRRKPRNWQSVPPFFSHRDEFGVLFNADFPDARQVFYAHPTGQYFAMFLCYTLLKDVFVSDTGFGCSTDNLPYETFTAYEACYHNFRDYAELSQHKQKNKWNSKPVPKLKARFTLAAPKFRCPTWLETPSQDFYQPLPDDAVIRVCLTDVFFPTHWCWCLAPTP